MRRMTQLIVGDLLVAVMVLSILVGMAPALVGAEEVALNALAAWHGEGRIFRTSKDQGIFWGALTGVLFVQSGDGALHAARLVCPATLDVDLTTGRQAGEGRCIITAASGDRVLARWNCAGVHSAGCRGRFTLTGGTGRFQGVTGESEFVVQSALVGIAASRDENTAAEGAVGLAVWPSLRLRLP